MLLDNYFLDPIIPITINIIGAGGTGSRLAVELAKTNLALQALNHPGINVTLIDFDIVDKVNPVRQQFFESEIGMYKSDAIITRINRTYGFNWTSKSRQYKDIDSRCNILISCVDNIKTRLNIENDFKKRFQNNSDFRNLYYWIDIGNDRHEGQIYVNTYDTPTLFERFKNLINQEDPQYESCSIQESLNKQDLYINSIMAIHCSNMIWRWFKTATIPFTEFFINCLNYNISTNEHKIARLASDGNQSHI